MGTRSGSIDPGILTFLIRGEHPNENQLDAVLNHESGLLGISGVSSDMRDILKAAGNGNKRAKLAFDIFVGDFRINLHDKFQLQQDPIAEALSVT